MKYKVTYCEDLGNGLCGPDNTFTLSADTYDEAVQKACAEMSKYYDLYKYEVVEVHRYKVPVSWEMYGYIEVEADTPENAVDYVDENQDEYALPDNGEYISGSFIIESDPNLVIRV